MEWSACSFLAASPRPSAPHAAAPTQSGWCCQCVPCCRRMFMCLYLFPAPSRFFHRGEAANLDCPSKSARPPAFRRRLQPPFGASVNLCPTRRGGGRRACRPASSRRHFNELAAEIASSPTWDKGGTSNKGKRSAEKTVVEGRERRTGRGRGGRAAQHQATEIQNVLQPRTR